MVMMMWLPYLIYNAEVAKLFIPTSMKTPLILFCLMCFVILLQSTISIKGKTFVLTGQLANMERDDAKELIVKHGGRVVSALSGKVNYMVAGEDAGVSKMAKVMLIPASASMYIVVPEG